MLLRCALLMHELIVKCPWGHILPQHFSPYVCHYLFMFAGYHDLYCSVCHSLPTKSD